MGCGCPFQEGWKGNGDVDRGGGGGGTGASGEWSDSSVWRTLLLLLDDFGWRGSRTMVRPPLAAADAAAAGLCLLLLLANRARDRRNMMTCSAADRPSDRISEAPIESTAPAYFTRFS